VRGSLRRRLTILLVACGALLAVVLVVAGVSIRSLDQAQENLVQRVQVARIASKDLAVALLDQEAGVRAFVVVSDGGLLEPSVAGLDAEERAVDEITAALPDDPAVAAALTETVAAAERWRDEVALPVVSAAADGRPADAEALLEAGAPALQEVRDRSTELDALIEERRDAGVARFDDALARLVVIGIAGAALLVTMGVAVSVALRRSVLGPLDALGRDAMVVAAGDFEHAIEVGGPEEIRRLGEVIEQMRLRVTEEFFQVLAARADLADKAEELERSNRDLEQFAYVASHDLQEPLRKVAGFCQLLERRYAGTLDERADEYIHYAVDGAQRMQELISDLLAFSRVGRTTDRFEMIDLGAVVAATWNQLDTPDDARLEVHDELPTIAGDPALIRALFTNLLGNSMKFTGDEPPRVEISASTDGERWELTVQDNGIGIDPEFADRIFVIFQRLHTRDSFEGTGIGLALCKRIVEFHGGSIRLAESERGARFVITLPVASDAATIQAPEPQIPRPESTPT
jgi:signal transduction histidine kinase